MVLCLLIRGCDCVVDHQTPFSPCHNEHRFSRVDYANFVREQRMLAQPHSRLFSWCSEDVRCSAAYHIQAANSENEQVFRYLSSKWLPRTLDIMQPLNDTVCATASYEALLQQTWLLEMRLQAHENARVQCGSNKRFVFSAETMEGHCVCIEDRNCEGGGDWNSNLSNFSTVSIVIVAAVLVIVLLVNLCATCAQLDLYQRLTVKCRQKCGGRATLTKNL